MSADGTADSERRATPGNATPGNATPGNATRAGSDIGSNTRTYHSSRLAAAAGGLGRDYLAQRLTDCERYDRIAGYFSSSVFAVAGDEIEKAGHVRIVCNAELERIDVEAARRAARAAANPEKHRASDRNDEHQRRLLEAELWREWCEDGPLLERVDSELHRTAIQTNALRLAKLLAQGRIEIRVLPERAFGLVHGKAGLIVSAHGEKRVFLGSANETFAGWNNNYELLWEDTSPEAVSWFETEFEALWEHTLAYPLSDAIVKDITRLSKRRIVEIKEWRKLVAKPPLSADAAPLLAAAVIEEPVYRRETGLWAHQKRFVHLVHDQRSEPEGNARLLLADQVGLGKTIQLGMAAQLLTLRGDGPVLVICPKTLRLQWQDELRDMLSVPSAVWLSERRLWSDETGTLHGSGSRDDILRCPRRIGIVSSGLITQGGYAAERLSERDGWGCVILDEAHHARRKQDGSSGKKRRGARGGEGSKPNNLLAFMHEIAPRTRSLLLSTATPVQLDPTEAYDLLEIMARGTDSVIGDKRSVWRTQIADSLDAIRGETGVLPRLMLDRWKWLSNPLPPSAEGKVFALIRKGLAVRDTAVVVSDLPSDRSEVINKYCNGALCSDKPGQFSELIRDHNPYVRRIVRRTRAQLERKKDEAGRPLLDPIQAKLAPDSDTLIRLPQELSDAYVAAEKFSSLLGKRHPSGFLKTLLLRRAGSSIAAGQKTAETLLHDWSGDYQEDALIEDKLDELLAEDGEEAEMSSGKNSNGGSRQTREMWQMTQTEREALSEYATRLSDFDGVDPKFEKVRLFLDKHEWIERGCVIFSQYRDSILALADYLRGIYPNELIGLYSGADSSRLYRDGVYEPIAREELKRLVAGGSCRLLLGTDAAAEGLNLQRLGTLIHLDLPWNPTRLEQRKGRIQRIGQIHPEILIANLRYSGSVESRVYELLSERLRTIYEMFGQLPDTIEDAWIKMALGAEEEAQKIIGAIPNKHPFDLRYREHLNPVDWESCELVLDRHDRLEALNAGW